MLLREGIGWGYMPELMVREDVEAGRLVHLDMPELRCGSLMLRTLVVLALLVAAWSDIAAAPAGATTLHGRVVGVSDVTPSPS